MSLIPMSLELSNYAKLQAVELTSRHVVWPYMWCSYSTSWTSHHFRPEVKTPHGDTCHTVAAVVLSLAVCCRALYKGCESGSAVAICLQVPVEHF